MKTLSRSLVATTLACCAFDAAPYQEAGHFFTAYALVGTADPGDKPRPRMLTALCAQLPDMAADLDATEVYFRLMKRNPIAWARWGASNYTGAEDVRKMVTIQQLLHALTGGTAQDVQLLVAKPLVESLRSAAATAQGTSQAIANCAWGFGLHFYGDAVAHERMDEPLVDMYSTGKGHAIHLNYPDFPLCDVLASGAQVTEHCLFTHKGDQRFGHWKQIWSQANGIYDVAGFKEKNPQVRISLLNGVAQLGDSADDANGWNEDAMRDKLVPLDDERRVTDYVDFIKKQHSNDSCENVLRNALQDIPELKRLNITGLTCAAVWKSYYSAATRAFSIAGAKRARADLGKPFEQIYVEMPLDK